MIKFTDITTIYSTCVFFEEYQSSLDIHSKYSLRLNICRKSIKALSISIENNHTSHCPIKMFCVLKYHTIPIITAYHPSPYTTLLHCTLFLYLHRLGVYKYYGYIHAIDRCIYWVPSDETSSKLSM